VLKVELHTHTSDDPADWIPHSAHELIDRAAALGYDAVAITLHDSQFDVGPLAAYAAGRGIVLIPGIERTIEGRHVLLLNFPAAAAEAVQSFDDLAHLKQRARGLVVAPHPFFPMPCCLLGKMDRHAGIIDAVEYNAMYTSSLNFNRAAERWARRHGKPMVGNGDVHRLEQLGTTYSLVDAERDAASICDAIAAGRVRVATRPLSWWAAIRIYSSLLLSLKPRPTRLQSCDFEDEFVSSFQPPAVR
jgi:predicted metal-dependent phosphoesterase TrpH